MRLNVAKQQEKFRFTFKEQQETHGKKMAVTLINSAGDLEAVTDVIFNTYCGNKIQGLTADELQALYQTLRPDCLSVGQIKASLEVVCETTTCDKEDLMDVLKEMDRRYFLVNDLKWEFELLDRSKKGAISEKNAKFLFKMVHGEFFSLRRWTKFVNSRPASGSLISFAEIEVDLCNIPTMGWIEEILEEEEEESRVRRLEREEEERAKRKAAEERKKKEEEQRQKLELKKKKQEEAKANEEKEAKRKKKLEEERKQAELKAKKDREEQKRLAEEQEKKELEKAERMRKEEERRRQEEEEEQNRQEALLNWKKAELLAKQEAEKEKMKEENEAKLRQREEEIEAAEVYAELAELEEENARDAAKRAAEEAKNAKDGEAKRRAEEAEKKALAEAYANKEKKLRLQLTAATNTRKTDKIRNAVKEAKDAKMKGLKPDIEDAEKVLDNVEAGEKLRDAMSRRHLGDVEAAVNNIRRKKYEKDYALDLIDADKLMNKLRRLERLRKEILELNQSTIMEIRSYQKPPPAVHEIMIAVYLLLGYKEKELKVWKNMQAFLGRTGKEGLKRQVTTLEPSKINTDGAKYVEDKYLSKHDLDTIRDVSAGAATFYVWSISMIEEAKAWKEEDEKRKILEKQKKKEEEAEREKEEERKKAREEKRKLGLTVDDQPSRAPSAENVRTAAAETTAKPQASSSKPTASTKPPTGGGAASTKSPTPAKTTKPASSGPANKAQITRGRTTVRIDSKNERSKSQPTSKKTSTTSPRERSTPPGKPPGKK
eukprot:gene4876-5515_t